MSQRSFAVLPFVLVLIGLGAVPATAQTALATYEIPGPLGYVGERVGVAGDVDGDGVNDLLAGGEFGVATFSGDDGTLLGFQPYELNTTFDSLLNVAGLDDADGDGQLDLVVCTTGDGAQAFSRATGALLWSVPGSPGGSLGWRLAILGDVDGDGVDDIAFGEPDADPHGMNSAGSIHVVSVATGSLITRINGTAAQQQFGRAISGFDSGGNGAAVDIIVGDKAFQVAPGQTGRLLILAAQTGAILFQVPNGTAGTGIGLEVDDAGDLDGDGAHDLATTGTTGGSQTRAYSGQTGALLWTRPGTPTFILCSVGDVNGDGAPELVAAAPNGLIFPGFGHLIDGGTGAFLKTLTGAFPYSFLSMAAPGDVTGDGLPDLVHGNLENAQFAPKSHASVKALPAGNTVLSVGLPANHTGVGAAGAIAGDFDGDGLDDIALAGMNDVTVFSRASGELLQQIDYATPVLLFGFPALVAPGDLNADGVPDLVVSDGFASTGSENLAGRLVSYSGADGSTLGTAGGTSGGENFALSMAATVDRDGDGVRDLYVGVPGQDVSAVADAGVVQLRSGATLAVIATLTGQVQASGRFGQSVDAGADLNGDGIPELAVGSREELPGQMNAGTLYLLDGASGAPLWTASGVFDALQVEGEIVGDGNADEVPDVLAAEWLWPDSGAGTDRGRIRLLSGATGQELWQVQGQPGQSLGLRFGAAGDVNGDGYADVAASHTDAVLGTIVGLYSGLDGAPLDLIDLPPDTTGAGALLALGRFDAGSCDDVLVGSTGIGGNGGAFVYASSQGGLHGFTDLGHAKATATGALPTLKGYGGLDGGEVVTLRARHLPPLKAGSWFIGLTAGYVPFKQGVLVPSPFGLFLRFVVATNGAGEFTINGTNPASVFLGLTIYHQIWIQDPGAPAGVCATNGLAETFK